MKNLVFSNIWNVHPWYSSASKIDESKKRHLQTVVLVSIDSPNKCQNFTVVKSNEIKQNHTPMSGVSVCLIYSKTNNSILRMPEIHENIKHAMKLEIV